MVSEHSVLNEGELQKISVMEGGEIIGQLCRKAGAGISPVVFEGMAALEAADEQVVDACSAKDPKAVNKRGLAQGSHFPVALAFSGHDDDPGIRRVVGGVEFVNSQELTVSSGNRSHGHNAAGLVPDFFQAFAVFAEEVAGIALLGSGQKASLSLYSDLGHGVAFFQICYHFLFDVHFFYPLLFKARRTSRPHKILYTMD